MNESLVQVDTCTKCGMPYGSPDPEAARSRLYCDRCANLPQNVVAVLEMHHLQMRRKMDQIRAADPLLDPAITPALLQEP